MINELLLLFILDLSFLFTDHYGENGNEERGDIVNLVGWIILGFLGVTILINVTVILVSTAHQLKLHLKRLKLKYYRWKT